MTEPTWSTEPPKEPGLWPYRELLYGEPKNPIIVRIKRLNRILWNDSSGCPLQKEEDTEWLSFKIPE